MTRREKIPTRCPQCGCLSHIEPAKSVCFSCEVRDVKPERTQAPLREVEPQTWFGTITSHPVQPGEATHNG
jgi:hypothetical protein